MKDWVLSVIQWHDMVLPGRQPEVMLMRCLSDGRCPGDTRQSPEEVAVHLSNSGLIYKSEECEKPRPARPTLKAA